MNNGTLQISGAIGVGPLGAVLSLCAGVLFCLSSCAHQSPHYGEQVTQPIRATIAQARPAADRILAHGTSAKSKDAQAVVAGFKKLDIEVPVLAKQIDTLSVAKSQDDARIVKDQKRIYTDDFIFAVPILVLGGVIFFKLAKFAAL